MSLTYEQANDDILAMLQAAWDPTGHEIFYEQIREQRENDNSAWAVANLRHATGSQRTLGGPGSRSFNRTGNLIVQIFTPIGKGLQESYQLAKIVADAYEGKSSENGVWFRNVRANEIGPDGMFYQINVIIDFDYDEVK